MAGKPALVREDLLEEVMPECLSQTCRMNRNYLKEGLKPHSVQTPDKVSSKT